MNICSWEAGREEVTMCKAYVNWALIIRTWHALYINREFSTVQAILCIWSPNRKNLIVGLDDHQVWRWMRLAKCKAANALWDCARTVLFYCFVDDGMFNRSSAFPVRILTSVRSLMVSLFKSKGRWHWQFSPPVIKKYPTAAPMRWCVIIFWLSWNV